MTSLAPTPTNKATERTEPLERRNSHISVVMEKKDTFLQSSRVRIASGHLLGGEELEDFCSQRGLCPLCARTKTKKKSFKLMKRAKWENLTVTDSRGEFTVYKGYCVKPDCFTLEQARQMLGEGLARPSPAMRTRFPKRWTSGEDNYHLGDDDSVDSNGDSNGNSNGEPSKTFPPEELKIQRESKPSNGVPLVIIDRTIQVLGADKAVTIVDLSMVQLRSIDITTLVNSLRTNTTLASLIMENCILDDEQASILGRGLAQAHDIPLSKLYLAANKIGDAGITAICEFLEASSTLLKFDIARNECSTMGAVAIFNAFHRNSLTKIKAINMAHNVIWDLDEDRFGCKNFLSRNKTLRVLNLEGNHINTEGVQSLAKGIMANDKSSLERLYLGFNSIGDDGAIVLAGVLEENRTLKYLGITENEIGNPGARALLAALEKNTAIQDISGLWRNKIDRRFIIFAIRRLLLAHERMDTRQEQAPMMKRISDDQMSSLSADMSISDSNGKAMLSSTPPKRRSNNRSVRPRNGVNGEVARVVPNAELNKNADRITLFQSAPLAYLDKNLGVHRSIPLQDFRHEASILRQSLSYSIGSTIEVSVRVGTMKNLSKVLVEKESRVMHFSCFGHPEYVTLENGYGLLHTLPVDALAKLLSNSGNNLQVVFVSSCFSLAIGQAFVNAGVPHVVCCERDETFRDPVASDFAQIFYQALATKLTLQEAFNSACKSIALSFHAKTKRNLMNRFHLLPHMPDIDSYHNIPVFFTSPVPPCDIGYRGIKPQLPKVPTYYLGREVDMFEILEALRVEDVIKIFGPPGLGKQSIVAAVSDYMLQRKDAFSIDEVFWLPPPEGVSALSDSLYGDLCECVRILQAATSDIWDTDERLLECRDRIDLEMENLRAVLVVNDAFLSFQFRRAQEGFEKFLSHLLNASQAKVIKILNCSDASSAVSSSSKVSQTSKIEETTFEINPLDFRSTALLFGGISKFISSSGCPAAHSSQEFAQLVEPAFITKMANASAVISQRRSDLFARMGSGIPENVVAIASGQSKQDFIEIIKVANMPEVFVDTLGSLEATIRKRVEERNLAVQEKNFLRGMDLDNVIEELESMRPEFPTLDELRMEEEVMKDDLADAIANRNYDDANCLKRDFLVLKKKIMKERMTSRDSHIQATTERMDEVQAQIQSMMDELNLDGNNLSTAFMIDCGNEVCKLCIEVGEIYDVKLPSLANGTVIWTNESCELGGNQIDDRLLKRGGHRLVNDISSLPTVVETPNGPVRCGTGNAVIVGPEKYGDLGSPCIILSVGPLSPNNSRDASDDDTDTLQHIKIMLRSSYRSTLILAKHAGLHAIGLTLLTTRKTGRAYKETIQIGVETLVEEVKFSSVRHVCISAPTSNEAALIISILSEMGFSRVNF